MNLSQTKETPRCRDVATYSIKLRSHRALLQRQDLLAVLGYRSAQQTQLLPTLFRTAVAVVAAAVYNRPAVASVIARNYRLGIQDANCRIQQDLVSGTDLLRRYTW